MSVTAEAPGARDSASTTITSSSIRTASRINCSMRIRREFLRTASSRNFIAAHCVSRNFRRLSRWISSGAPATDISFTMDKPDLLKAKKVIDGLKGELQIREVIANESIGKLSIVGVGMKSHTGVAGKMFETLAKEGVNIDMISTSEIKISVVIDLAKGEQALRAVHAAFVA